MGIIIEILIGILILGFVLMVINAVCSILKQVFPYVLGLIVLIGGAMLLSYLPWGAIGGVVFQIIYTIIMAIIIAFVGNIVSDFSKQSRYNGLLLPMMVGLIFLNLYGSVLEHPKSFFVAMLVSIVVMFWGVFQQKKIHKNINVCAEVAEGCKKYQVGMFFALSSILLYLFKVPNYFFNESYMQVLYLNVLSYLGVFVAINSLYKHTRIYPVVQSLIYQRGYAVSGDLVQELLEDKKIVDKNMYIKQILSKLEENKTIVAVKGKQTVYFLTDIYQQIIIGVKERRTTMEIVAILQRDFKILLPEKLVDFAVTTSNVEVGVTYDPLEIGFMLMKYEFKNHPMVNERKIYRIIYYKLFRHLLQTVEKSSPAFQIFLRNFENILGIQRTDGDFQSTDIQKLFKQICKEKFWHGGFRFDWRDYRFLLLIEVFYFMGLLQGRMEYSSLNKYCDSLQINTNDASFLMQYMETIFLPNRKIESILSTCKNKHLLHSIEYLQENIQWNHLYASLPRYNVAVCATMSSGKSTLINALFGRDYIPSKNQACTAKITSIYDNDCLDKVIGSKVNNIKTVLYNENIDRAILEDWNNDNDVKHIFLEGDLEDIHSDQGVLVIHDTPGTNYSQDQNHRMQTMNFLQNTPIDMIIYVINAEHVSTMDNKILLQQIKECVIDKNNAKIMFLVNKLDSFDIEKNDDIKKCLDNIKKDLIEAGYQNPLIVPIVANAARLFKMALRGETLTKKETADFTDLYELFMEENFDVTTFGNYMPDIPTEHVNKENGKIQVAGKEYSRESLVAALKRTGITFVAGLLDKQINIRGNI